MFGWFVVFLIGGWFMLSVGDCGWMLYLWLVYLLCLLICLLGFTVLWFVLVLVYLVGLLGCILCCF